MSRWCARHCVAAPMSIDPQIRYAHTADGVSIAFWTLGHGRPTFMDSPLTFSHCALEPGSR
jgi:hypothetical protein